MTQKITALETHVAPYTRATWLDETPVSTRLSLYPRFAQKRSSWRGPGADTVAVRLSTDGDDSFGLGQTRGGKVTEGLIREHLAPLLIGQDPTDITSRVDEISLAIQPYASGGIASMAVSCVELALWDLAARRVGLPLAELLGGSLAPLTTYVTIGDPATLANFGSESADWPIVKVAMPCGPVEGEDGLRRNIALLHRVAETLSDNTALAVDCFMSWNESYTRRFIERADKLNLAWVEEPLPPGDWRGYQRLRGSLGSVALAGGEHLYGLPAALRFLEYGCVDIIQTDVTWCGGIRTSLAIAAAAEASGVTYAPHDAGSQPWATHLLGACSRRSLAEVVIRPGMTDDAYPVRPMDGPGVGLSGAQLGFGN